MRWPWWHRRRPGAQRPVVNPRRQELETAKEILAEVFGAQPSDVEEMIRLRLEASAACHRTSGLLQFSLTWISKSVFRHTDH
jgi:hypothetical protein